MRRNRSLHRLITALLLGAACLPGAAQDPDPLYRVELLILSHEGNLGAERWRAYPELAYPAEARFLIDSDRLDANLKEFPGEAELDRYGRQLITMPPDPEAERAQGGSPAEGKSAGAAGAEPAAEPLVRPFHLLGRDSFELNTWGVRRSGRYRVLFHEAWIQPVAEQSRALPIVLDRSGDSGEWPPWQGSVLIYLSRFLHLETNLWVNTRGDYLPAPWSLPPAPLGPPSVLVDGLPPYLYREARLAEEQAEQAAAYPGLPVVGGDPPAQEDAGDAQAPAAEAEPLWPWRHAVLIRQQRRMRSEEVHYVDHPLLGLVIKLTPVDAAALEAERTAAQAVPLRRPAVAG